MRQSLSSVSLGLCTAVALATSAFADAIPGYGEPLSRTVELADLNLHTTAGAKTAAFRIEAAAKYVCGGGGTVWASDFDFRHCGDQAIDQALADALAAGLRRPRTY